MNGSRFVTRLRQWIAAERVSFYYRARLDEMDIPPAAAGDGYAILTYPPEGATAHPEILPSLPPVAVQDIKQGNLTLVAAVDDAWICRISAVKGPAPQNRMGMHFPLHAQDAYLENLETVPAWRRLGVANTLVARLLQELRRQQVQTIHMLIDVDNTPSIQLFEKWGCHRAGVVISHRRFGRWRTRVVPLGEEV